MIETLIREYPEYIFYYLDYSRVITLSLSTLMDIDDIDIDSDSAYIDYRYEFIYSLANLYSTIDASGFVGSLTSNWCSVIQYMELTRGDGGTPYHSLDRTGSTYTPCY